ncbi:MAG: DUF4912 domain-containing protein [Acidobacteriota bacterium]
MAQRKLSPAQPEAKEEYVDTGLPLPESYQLDMIRMLVHDPYRVFIFWELSGMGLERAARRAEQLGFTGGQLTLQVTRVASKSRVQFDVGVAREWWLIVEPDTEYMAEIGLAFDDHFFAVATSNRVRTPRVSLADFEMAPPPAEESRAADVIRASGFEPATAEQIREKIREKRELTPREKVVLGLLPPEIREALVAEGTPSEVLRKVVWAAPRFMIVGSERLQLPASILEWLAWPWVPLAEGRPTSPPQIGIEEEASGGPARP